MLIAYLLHPSLFNLLTDHFLFRAQQQIHFLSPVNLFTIWANAIGATLPPPENSASLHIKKKKRKKSSESQKGQGHIPENIQLHEASHATYECDPCRMNQR